MNVQVGTHTDPRSKKDEKVYMKTIVCGADTDLRFYNLRRETKPILVFLHGFGGSGALYYKLFKELMNHFCLITVDMVGMGGSSRPNNFDHKKFTP